jgi:hypothetical protein
MSIFANVSIEIGVCFPSVPVLNSSKLKTRLTILREHCLDRPCNAAHRSSCRLDLHIIIGWSWWQRTLRFICSRWWRAADRDDCNWDVARPQAPGRGSHCRRCPNACAGAASGLHGLRRGRRRKHGIQNILGSILICCLCVARVSPATNAKHSQDQQLLLQGSFEGPLSFSERAIAQLSLSKTASSPLVCKWGSIVRFQMAARVPEIFHAGVRWYLLIGLDSLLIDTFVFLTPAPQSPRTAHWPT